MKPAAFVIWALLTMPLAHAGSLESLAWLSGCWQSRNDDLDSVSGSVEIWSPPSGGAMLGLGRTLRDGVLVSQESMQIREQPDGAIVFVAQPSGQASTIFTMVSKGDRSIVFEAPEHDFPQRVAYSRDGNDLNAYIEGRTGTGTRRIDFPMQSAPCNRVGEPGP